MRLGPAFTRGAFLLTGVMVVQNVLALFALAVLTRLVSPFEFGQAVLAATVAEFLAVIASMSLAAALLREDEKRLPTTFRAALVLETGVFAVVILLALPVAWLLAEVAASIVAWIFLAIVGSRFFAFIGHLYLALVERRLQYGRMAVIVLASQAVSLGVAVAVGASGGGPWAVAAREICLSVSAFLLSVALAGRVASSSLDWARMRELWKFGVAMIGSRLADSVFHRVDNLVVAAFSGPRALRLYNQAYVLAEACNKVLVSVISYLPLNFYGKLQGEPDRVQRTYDLIMFVLARIVTPIGVVMLVSPEEPLTVVFGDDWAPAAGMLRGLAAYAILLPIFEHAHVLLVAYGAVNRVLVARAIQIGAFLPLLFLLAWQFGAEGAGAAVAVAMILGTAAIVREANSYARLRLGDLILPLVAGVLASAISVGISDMADLSPVAGLAMTVGVAFGVQALATSALEWDRAGSYLRWIFEAVKSKDPEAAMDGTNR